MVMANVLITGGAGFIGSSLADRLLLDARYKVTLVDNLLTGDVRKVPQHANCTFIPCDVNQHKELGAIMTNHAFDYVLDRKSVV